MRAAVLLAGAKTLVLEDRPLPEPDPGEVLVRVAACGICRTDLHYLHGTPTFRKPPIVLGHEISGRVERVGAGVTGWPEGERVLVPPVIPCGECAYCRAGRGTLCSSQVMLGNHRDGGFAEAVTVPSKALFRLPESIPLKEGCIISDAISTPYHAVVNRAEVRPGQWVAVFGCGGVGLAAVRIAVLAGANVVAVDVIPRKLELARALGAVETVDAKVAGDVPKALRKLTGGGPDTALEVIGNPATIAQAFASVRWGGRVVVVGYTDADVAVNMGRVMFREIEIRGSLGCGLQDFPKVIELVRSGQIPLEKFVTHRFPLERVNDGLRLLESGDPTLVRGIAVP